MTGWERGAPHSMPLERDYSSFHHPALAAELTDFCRSLHQDNEWALPPYQPNVARDLLLADGNTLFTVHVSSVGAGFNISGDNELHCNVHAATDGSITVDRVTNAEDAQKEYFQRLQRLTSATPRSNYRVPYGFLKDGRIAAIYWLQGGHTEDRDGETYYCTHDYLFTAEDEAPPGELIRDEHWYARFKAMVESGQLVRLTDSLNDATLEYELFLSGECLLLVAGAFDERLASCYIQRDVCTGEIDIQEVSEPVRAPFAARSFS